MPIRKLIKDRKMKGICDNALSEEDNKPINQHPLTGP